MGPPLRYFIRSLFLTCRSFCETRLSENQQQRSDQVVGGSRHGSRSSVRLPICLWTRTRISPPPNPNYRDTKVWLESNYKLTFWPSALGLPRLVNNDYCNLQIRRRNNYNSRICGLGYLATKNDNLTTQKAGLALNTPYCYTPHHNYRMIVS